MLFRPSTLLATGVSLLFAQTAVCQITADQVISNLNGLTGDAQALANTALTVDTASCLQLLGNTGPLFSIIAQITAIDTTLDQVAAQMRTSPPITDADNALAIFVAYRYFVRSLHTFLDDIIVRGCGASFCNVLINQRERVATALLLLENSFAGYSRALLELIPAQRDATESNFELVYETAVQAAEIYDVA
ncbi:hypothetical protein B0T17DRAFT_658561 [Bombardia bombarda]|uniref:Uncharacterized protein n=1 Tax=Bombardia bombarda TaxID=252184 RepID=A0AA39TGJ8_9PEZI|nr:hypothetical protein B0T17DRAFT_658561 [Bombardia bombarda]